MASSSSSNHRKVRRKQTTISSSSSSSSSWCCSFRTPPKSPEPIPLSSKTHLHKVGPTLEKSPLPPKLQQPPNSFPSSPQSSKSGLGLVGRRRILSPGRVSPICDPNVVVEEVGPTKVISLGSLGEVVPTKLVSLGSLGEEVEVEVEEGRECSEYDVRLSLKGKNHHNGVGNGIGGGTLVLELNSRVLVKNSGVFSELIRKGKKSGGCWRIEVPQVEDLGVFRETIELMFEDDVVKKLIKVGPFRAIDILEVSASIKFNRGVLSCLKYLEAVPWTGEEEEKLRRLFTKFKFDDATNNEIFSRLNIDGTYAPQQNFASQLVRSVAACGNAKARNDLKSMVKGLLSKSSVYEKDHIDITKEELYSVCECCISSLVTLFQEASGTGPLEPANKKNIDKPLIESVSWQVENLSWLLEILLDRQIAEDFVDLWASQEDLLEMHKRASPMVRYELSRVSAVLFVAMGTRKLQCRAESRFGLLQSWFGPMLLDFGWLQRCRKGLNVRELEEAMGQALLTLPLKQQYSLFMEWFRCFSKHGTECPNLGKAFQIWWRRSFLRGSETHAIESR